MPDPGTPAGEAADRARRAGRQVEQSGREVQQSSAFRWLVTVGLIAYGVVHLLIAWLAVQLAWSGTSQEASQQGAFQELASTSVGVILLWVTAIGLFALALWQLFEALWGHQDREAGRKRIVKRLGSTGKAIVYAALGVTAATTAAGSSSSGDGQQTLTARLLSEPFGQILVAAIGVGIIVVGGRLVYRAVTKGFTKDLDGAVGAGVVRLGQTGFLAKGVVLAIVGVLFVIAAVTFDPEKAGGMDAALRTLRDQAFGPILLTAMALGIACFGLYCFAWSRNAKHN